MTKGFCHYKCFVYLFVVVMVCQLNTRLSDHIDAWTRIGTSNTVLDWVSQGVPLTFVDKPSVFSQDNYVLTDKEVTFVDNEIQELLLSGAIRISETKPVCISPLKCVPKRQTFRLIHDLRYVNKHLESVKFQYDGIETVCEYIQPLDELVTVDLKSGFHHVPVLKAHQKYLGFKWRSVWYVWQVLPFGLGCSPWYFYKVLRPVVQFLREQHLRVVLYVDDLILMSTDSQITDHKDFVLQTFDELGLVINTEKSDLEPSTTKDYIGYTVTSKGPDGNPWLYVPAVRLRRLRKDIRRCMKRGRLHARLLAKIIGQCISMSKAVPPTKLKVRALYRLLNTKQSWSDILVLGSEANESLQWFLDCMDSWNGALVKVRPVECQIFSDASDSGWGAVLNDREASGVWSSELAHLSINYRELLAVLFALQTFSDQIIGRSVQVMCDNVTAVAYVNHLGGSGRLLSKLAEAVWAVAWGLDLQLHARHLAGVTNV